MNLQGIDFLLVEDNPDHVELIKQLKLYWVVINRLPRFRVEGESDENLTGR